MFKNGQTKNYGVELFSDIDMSALNFMEDFTVEGVNELFNMLFYKYYSYYLIYSKDRLQTSIKYRILERAGELNHIYSTTQYEYNPIENYNMVEDADNTNTGTSSSTGENNAYEFPMNSLTAKQVGKNNTSSSSTASNSEKRRITRSGNVGVTTTQQMIEAERSIIICMFDVLCKHVFDDFFFLSDEEEGE